jgi:hypothetical protein
MLRKSKKKPEKLENKKTSENQKNSLKLLQVPSASTHRATSVYDDDVISL